MDLTTLPLSGILLKIIHIRFGNLPKEKRHI